ncbi:MAG: hypothetical protein HY951_05575 [Bacteroidia bacterium]|nr:hypothetical protein [Bacteroidia bacterium]
MLKKNYNTTLNILNEDIVQAIKEIISDKLYFDLNQFDNFVLRKRLSDAFSFLKLLPEQVIEKPALLDTEKIDILTGFLFPGENELFRDTDTWIYLRDKILKEILIKENSKILIYNATTGEELYSMLILLNEYFPNNNINVHISSPSNFSISKINEGILAQPKNRSSLLNFKVLTLNKDVTKYLELNNNILSFKKDYLTNNVHILNYKDHISNKVEYDLVICRNKTLVYSDVNTYSVFKDIISLIKPKGYFVIGTNENLPKEFSTMFNVISNNEKIFCKKSK